ncbi:hypothetical protein KIM372_05280 [Bombiscardovia nodaiensis]|uniref:Uncharacterized protein n=1 Tax=Bombiscardovia nodaiensis TaxID=2932181 RepID=A0ABN6SBV9_9BIFI|nr:hypothetical protein KIM372_05280 [Bombiscardovia nodaiensis]
MPNTQLPSPCNMSTLPRNTHKRNHADERILSAPTSKKAKLYQVINFYRRQAKQNKTSPEIGTSRHSRAPKK